MTTTAINTPQSEIENTSDTPILAISEASAAILSVTKNGTGTSRANQIKVGWFSLYHRCAEGGMTSNQPLHRFNNIHLCHGSFATYIDGSLPGNTALLTPSGKIATQLLDEVPQIEESVEIYTGPLDSLPFGADDFEACILYTGKRGIHQRHQPFYEATRVVEKRGEILFRAPNYLPHSKAATIDEIRIGSWEAHADPAVFATFSVTDAGAPSTATDSVSHVTLADFQGAIEA